MKTEYVYKYDFDTVIRFEDPYKNFSIRYSFKEVFLNIRIWISLVISLLFVASLKYYMSLDFGSLNLSNNFHFLQSYECFIWFLPINTPVNFLIGMDGLSVLLYLLTTFIMPLCVFICWQTKSTNIDRSSSIFIFLLFIELILLTSFVVQDFLLFFIAFESLLIPMFFLIIVWGSRRRRVKASIYFFLYTLFGSFFMFFLIIFIAYIFKTTNFLVIYELSWLIDPFLQKFGFLFLLIGLLVKVPSYPVHIWLPEAHVEAPTVGSIILAALVLKLGTYGFIRLLLPIFPIGNIYFSIIIMIISSLSALYASVVTLRQIDIKKIIAYSSISHMNMGLMGLYSFSYEGSSGAVLLMMGHGFVSGALFYFIGLFYERYHTRVLKYYGGLVQVLPTISSFFFFFILCNMSLPPTINFAGELLIVLGISNMTFICLLFAGLSMFFSGVYSILLYNRMIFGTLKNLLIIPFDMTFREFLITMSFVSLAFLSGLQPLFIDSLFVSFNSFLSYLYNY